MVDQDPKKSPSIPSWQQQYNSEPKDNRPPPSDDQPPDHSTRPASPSAELPLLEQAQRFLEDDSIRDAPRERKVAFLEKKGLQAEEIEKLLGPERPNPPPTSEEASELKTIHDSSQTQIPEREETEAPSDPASEEAPPQQTTAAQKKRDVPPIITYPEFLLKPQKPPPLVTFERLAHAAYAFAGVSALTWAASKYIVQPMLETLTEARHDLADTARTDLETLNKKLESTVSHIPYIPSSAVLQQQQKAQDGGDDVESVDSDPTELFHRDVATQTSPRPSRSMSISSFPDNEYHYLSSAQDPTTSQSSRLRSLHSTLFSLLNSQNNSYSQDRLKDSVGGFQAVLDKLESSHNPFQVDFMGSGSSFTSYSGPGSSSTATATGTDSSKQKKQPPASEATKFKNEIRALKGALLSSRNFPTARPAQPFTLLAR
ncbi:uncharacterized protein Z520_06722 [Fonsecaea multimorphosa CBS 102226]|uniref:Peroxisomal membrane protein PEX14 n=1 Tax=Fonsecaea multimorphosa CBS 102226 TaxID=1442371 RepID=A0A0D2H5Z1_9EURO|nr:uncharacterized protein Z520_06722 [Fonsecaea multimorphosa CBS 102226]KIX97270.1 hypothetical protein Z520_06722 [Fonsecaea multimorphosa CBS 102226]OAL23238.1 hypothetical protein AYO22_06288 [Fonsecaea multimorphosa]